MLALLPACAIFEDVPREDGLVGDFLKFGAAQKGGGGGVVAIERLGDVGSGAEIDVLLQQVDAGVGAEAADVFPADLIHGAGGPLGDLGGEEGGLTGDCAIGLGQEAKGRFDAVFDGGGKFGGAGLFGREFALRHLLEDLPDRQEAADEIHVAIPDMAVSFAQAAGVIPSLSADQLLHHCQRAG